MTITVMIHSCLKIGHSLLDLTSQMLVFVVGRFDLLHSGHIALLEHAKRQGDRVFVDVCSDHLCRALGRPCRIPDRERQFLLEHLSLVWRARVLLRKEDLEADLEIVRPQVCVVNHGDPLFSHMEHLCRAMGIEFVAEHRKPYPGMPLRSAEICERLLIEGASTRHRRQGSGLTVSLNGEASPLERPIVFVSGCYDLLHSGHVAFFNEAAKHGKSLFVSIGSDDNILLLKDHMSMFPEYERQLLVANVKSVSLARVCSGSGVMDFEADLGVVKPDVFFVNEDGDQECKRRACEARGIEYIVGRRVPCDGLQPRSSTLLKRHIKSKKTLASRDPTLHDFPWRICLAGGWLDQPWVSSVHAGGVIVVNVKPCEEFKVRSGLATSSRQVGIDIWGTQANFPSGVPREKLARYLFGAENPPGTAYVSGSQDHLGLMLPGVNCLHYDGDYWPKKIEKIDRGDALDWLEKVLWLVPLPSRPGGYDPLSEKNITKENVARLAMASAGAWEAIVHKDAKLLGKSLTATLEAWGCLLPNTCPMPETQAWCAPYKDSAHGYLFSGCGGGFLIVVSESPVANGFQIKINRS